MWSSVTNIYVYDLGNRIYPVHDDVIKWKYFPRNWPFVWGIHWSRWIPHTKASDVEHYHLMGNDEIESRDTDKFDFYINNILLFVCHHSVNAQ